MTDNSLFTENLANLFLCQVGLIHADEELIPDPKTPASVGDILRSKSYWLRDEYGKPKRNKTP